MKGNSFSDKPIQSTFLGRRRHMTGFGGKQNVNSLKSAWCTVYSGVCGVHSAAQHRSATKVLHNLVHP